MGKPLSRPDCLRQNPRCLGKGEDEEGYIEDCYVPQRSIYDTMRINEQIDQGSKLSQPSRSTLGSGGGEGSTLSSNGTLGADVGGVFMARPGDGVRKLDERVIFDALKLTGEPQSKLPAGVVGASSAIIPSSSASGVAAAVTKRRHQGGDRKDNPNRRSWKAFMPPTYPEFAERLELSPGDSAEKRLSGAGIPVSPLQPLPSLLPPPLPSSTPPLPPSYSASPVSSGGGRTPPVSCSPSQILTPLPPSQHLRPRQKQLPPPHPLLLKQHKQTSALPSPSKEQPPLLKPALTLVQQGSASPPQQSRDVPREAERRTDEKRGLAVPPAVDVKHPPPEHSKDCDMAEAEVPGTQESEPPTMEQDQDTTPLLPPKPVFCPPTKARTWPRSMRGGRRSLSQGGGMLPNLPALPPLPPLLGEDSDLDEESLYLLAPPSPFLQDREGLGYGGLPLSPCLSQEGGEEGLLGWLAPSTGLRERTASELRFEEDEQRILQELEQDVEEVEEEGIAEQQEREQREERTWEAVLKLESRERAEEPHPNPGSSGHWPLLTPPSGFGGSERASVSPCPSSGLSSDDLFLELERQCLEEEDREVPPNLQPKTFTDPAECPEPSRIPPSLLDEDVEILVDLNPVGPLDSAQHPDLDSTESSLIHLDQNPTQVCLEQSDLEQTRACSEEPDTGQTQLLLGQPAPGETQPTLWPIPEREEGRTQEEEEDVEDVEEEDQSSHMAETEGTGGLVSEWARESDSSGIHMSNPELAGPSDTASDCERPETYSDLGSGVSSDRDSREEEKVGEMLLDDGQVPQPLSSPTLDNPYHPYSNEQDEDTEDPSWENRGDGVHLCSGPEDTFEESVMETEVSNPTLDEFASVELSETMEETTSDLHGIPQIVGTSDSDTFTVVAPAPEGVVGDEPYPEERITSTPKADSPQLPIETTPPNANSTPPPSLPLSPSKQEAQGADAFVPTDSFVYLAVSAPPLFPQEGPPSPLEESAPPSPLPKPESEEGAFLSSDSFVYLAAPERLPLAREGCSTYGDSDSEGSRSGVFFVLGSTTGDSDWDSDGSGPETALPAEDQWELLEPGFLQGLFEEFQTEPEVLGVGAPECIAVTSLPEEAEREVSPEPCPDGENEAEVPSIHRSSPFSGGQCETSSVIGQSLYGFSE